MQVRLSDRLQKELKKISKKEAKLFIKIKKQLAIFIIDPRHKSLRIHKLTGELENIWSISITRSIRMTYLQKGNEAYFFDIGTHDEVYRK